MQAWTSIVFKASVDGYVIIPHSALVDGGLIVDYATRSHNRWRLGDR